MANVKDKHILKSIVLSILIHFTILQIFIFKIPIQKVPFKPKLIFFGSILDSITNIKTRPNQIEKNYLTIKSDDPIKSNPLFNFQNQKPKPNLNKEIKKKNIKETFLRNTKGKTISAVSSNEINKIEKTTPYKPLELKNNDSY